LPEAEDLRRLADAFDAQETQLHYQIAITGRNELALAPDEYAGFTMTLLRMLAFRPTLTGIPSGRDTAIQGSAASKPSAVPASHMATAGGAPTRPPSPLLATRPAAVTSVQSKSAEAPDQVASVETVANLDMGGEWPELVARLEIKGLVRELARQSELVAVEGHNIRVRVAQKTLTEGAQIERLQAALSQHFGVAVKLRVDVGRTADTAAVRADAAATHLQGAAEQAFHAAPLVRQLIDQHGATLVPGSVRPISPGESS
jgi:DNA polymerase-3 subunit gamma/tau